MAAGGMFAVGSLIKALEDGEAETVVEEMLLGDDLPILDDLLDIAFERAGEERIGQPLPGDAERRFPAFREQGVAAAKGVGGGAALARRIAGLKDDPGFRQRLQEFRHRFASPAVVAGGGCKIWFVCEFIHEPYWNME